ncbi:MAG: hypothetical protein P8N76_26155 [Pirellulaceae bacterium]|nr:hypothetical protein [Pirellulaceae bacterium]
MQLPHDCARLYWLLLPSRLCFLRWSLLRGVPHFSYPLSELEKVIESSGDVQVEGLAGTISSGFHIDQLRFRTNQDQTAAAQGKNPSDKQKWSTLENIDFKFNGVWDLISEQRFIIDQLSVTKGIVYYTRSNKKQPHQNNSPVTHDDHDPSRDTDPSAKTSDKLLKEVRVDLIQVSNLKFIETVSGDESDLGKFAIKDFHYEDDKLQNIGLVEIAGLIVTSEDFQLTQLSGSTESGFQIERIAFKDKRNNWSHLDGIKFEFNGISDLVETQILVINQFSVTSGEVYTDAWTSSDVLSDENTPIDDLGHLPATETNQLQEVEIELLSLTKIKFLDSVSGVEATISEISVKDLKYQGSHLTSLGSVTIAADFLEFRDGPSQRFADHPDALDSHNFSGTVHAGMHDSILSDISFNIDLCFLKGGDVLQHASLFDGKMVRTQENKLDLTATFHEFTPTDYFDWKHGLLPAKINGTFSIKGDVKEAHAEHLTVSTDSSFELGKTLFNAKSGEILSRKDTDNIPTIFADHAADTGVIRCQLYGLDQEPYFAYQLESDDQQSAEVLYSQVFFNQPFDRLNSAQQLKIKNAIQAAKTVKGKE